MQSGDNDIGRLGGFYTDCSIMETGSRLVVASTSTVSNGCLMLGRREIIGNPCRVIFQPFEIPMGDSRRDGLHGG